MANEIANTVLVAHEKLAQVDTSKMPVSAKLQHERRVAEYKELADLLSLSVKDTKNENTTG